MTCQHFDEFADLYAAGELDPASAAEAQTHLAQCQACRERVAAGRARLGALEAALAAYRLPGSFVDRTMARILAEMAPAARREGPEPFRSRLLRYAAMAAAAVLFVLAGYGFLHKPPVARFESGMAAVAGPNARPLVPGTPLAVGDVLVTQPGRQAYVVLGGGRLRMWLAPQTVVRIADPRSGTMAQLVRGDALCRASTATGSSVVALPLAKVTPSDGVVGLHVTPQPASGSAGFRGLVTLVAHDGGAQVLVPGQQTGPVRLQRGQVLTLGTERRRAPANPISLDQLREAVNNELRSVHMRYGELELMWQGVTEGMQRGLPGDRGQLLRHAVEIQDAMRQAQAMYSELDRRLRLLDGYQKQGQQLPRLTGGQPQGEP